MAKVGRKPSTSAENKAETIISEYRYKLTPLQQDYLKENRIRVKDILKLTRGCFNDDFLDNNSVEYDNVRKYTVRLRKIEKGEVTEAYNFSDEEIEYIANKSTTMGAFDICKKLFPDKGDSIVRESQTAAELVRCMDAEPTCIQGAPVKLADGEVAQYRPPQNEIKVLAKINIADNKAQLHPARLDSRQKGFIRALKHNMNSPRFIATASSIKSPTLRDLFEIEFIRATYDKPDLNPEEANAYISLCNEYVLSAMLSEQLSELNDRLADAVNETDKATFHKNISDSRIAIAREYNDCQKRISNLQVDLNARRMERLGANNAANESLSKWIDLVEIEEGRDKMLRLMAARNLELEEEIKRIENFDDLIAEFYGVDQREILNF